MIKVMSIMAHQDDFEFRAAGTFAQMKKKYGNDIQIKLINTSRGATGHHIMSPDKTFQVRTEEFAKSAAVIGAESKCLTQLDGSHVQAQVFIDRNFLGGLWNTIRAFEPDYLFCPPITVNPLSGIHIDHYNTAVGVRMIAYQLCVPNAYPTIGGPVKKRIKMPLIINADDSSYSTTVEYHISNDVTDAFETKMEMALCHYSQLMEWLPFSRGEEPPTEQECKNDFIKTNKDLNLVYGKSLDRYREFFSFTSWGRKVLMEDIEKVFINVEKDQQYQNFIKTL